MRPPVRAGAPAAGGAPVPGRSRAESPPLGARRAIGDSRGSQRPSAAPRRAAPAPMPNPIDPELADYYATVARALPPVPNPDVAARRHRMEAIARRFPPAPDDVAREDLHIPLAGRELYARHYRAGAGPRPTLVYLHGGGWVAGSVATHDGIAAALARDGGINVLSVHYRRAPESPFPAPNDDAYAALAWVAANAAALDVDAKRLGIGGDSAGAHLAIGAALEARDKGGPALALQLLIYPVVEPDFERPSYRSLAQTPALTRADMIEYWKHYLPGGAASADARAIPTKAASLAGLPPAHVLVAELDPLRDEGLHFAGLLAAAGVPTSQVEVPALTHGFLRAAPFVRAARAAQRALGETAGTLLAGRR